MIESEASALLEKIYPAARTMVEAADTDGTLRVFTYMSEGDNSGVFAVVDRPSLVVGYLSFTGDLFPAFSLLLKRKFAPYLCVGEQREICCNVFGRNPRAIEMVQSLGFKQQMRGIKMACRSYLPERNISGLRVTGYQPGNAPQVAGLLDRAYASIPTGQGDSYPQYTNNLDRFAVDLAKLQEQQGVSLFWLEDYLAAACLLRGDYIRDLAVEPELQHRGLGAAALSHVVNERLGSGAPMVHLDVAMPNTTAQRFYTRMGFIEIGCFADHSWKSSAAN